MRTLRLRQWINRREDPGSVVVTLYADTSALEAGLERAAEATRTMRHRMWISDERRRGLAFVAECARRVRADLGLPATERTEP